MGWPLSVGPGSVAGEEDAEPVVGEVAEPVCQAPGLFDDEVDRFGAAVGHPAGGEVGQDLGVPLLQGAAEPGDLGDGAGVQAVEEVLGERAAGRRGGGVVDGADALVDLPCEVDLAVRVADGQPPFETLALPVGEVFVAGEQGAPDPVERVVFVALRSYAWVGLCR